MWKYISKLAIVIFPYKTRFSWKRIPLLLKSGLSAPKYSDRGLIQSLQETFSDTTLFDVTSPLLLIVSYDTISREPIIFKSWRKDKEYGNVPLWEACLCSASAPTYFPAHKLDRRVNGKAENASINTITLDDSTSAIDDIYKNTQIRITSGTGNGQIRTIKKYVGFSQQAIVDLPWEIIPDNTSTYSIKCIYSAIDGGVAANNPSSCAIAEALRLGYAIEDISILSIGTGDVYDGLRLRTRIIAFEKAQNWGTIQWAQPLVGLLLDASSDVYEYISNQIMNNRLLRLQFKLDRELTGKRLSDDIDDASQENITNLIEAADAYIQQPKIQAALQEFLRISQ